MADETRKGLVPEGWKKQGVVVPDTVWKSLRSQADDRGHGSMKVLATAGLGLIAGMPEHTRTLLAKWIIQANYDGAAHITPEAIYAEFLRLSQGDASKAPSNISVIGPVKPKPMTVVDVNGPTGKEITHEVTRILDPETLKGKKKGAA